MKKKLVLKKESLVNLQDADLAAVAAADWPPVLITISGPSCGTSGCLTSIAVGAREIDDGNKNG